MHAFAENIALPLRVSAILFLTGSCGAYGQSSPPVGDIRADGQVDVADMLLMQQAVGGQITLDPAQAHQADLYPDGGDDSVDLEDMLLLEAALAGRINIEMPSVPMPEPSFESGCTNKAVGWACSGGASISATTATVPTGGVITTTLDSGLKPDTPYVIWIQGGVVDWVEFRTIVTLAGSTAYKILGNGPDPHFKVLTPTTLTHTDLAIAGAFGTVLFTGPIVVQEIDDRIFLGDPQLTGSVAAGGSTCASAPGQAWIRSNPSAGEESQVGGGQLILRVGLGGQSMRDCAVTSADPHNDLIMGAWYRFSWGGLSRMATGQWNLQFAGDSGGDLTDVTHVDLQIKGAPTSGLTFARHGVSSQGGVDYYTFTAPLTVTRIPTP